MTREQAKQQERACKKVLLLLGPRFEDLEAACALDACGWTAYRPHLPLVHVDTVALEHQVCGNFGTRFDADLLIRDARAERYDGLVIPGGFRPDFDAVYCEEVYRLVRAFAASGKPIATMCVGSIVAARAGVLRGGQAATYEFSRHDNFAMLGEQGCTGVHKPVCSSSGVISCSGPAYSEQVMELFMERLLGAEAAAELQLFRRGIST
ncbi:MAG: DJ-1/PfpI family protein [Coriobacteriales bacterium]